MKNKAGKTLIIMALLCVVLMPVSAFADTVGGNGKVIPSASMDITARHVMEGDEYSGRDVFTFVLTPENPDSPMPEGTVDGIRSVSIAGKEEVIDFGQITYELPEVHYYLITRKDAEDTETLTLDKAEYRLMIAKLNDGSLKSIIYDKNSGEKVAEALYTDKYTEPPKDEESGDGDKTARSKTGDEKGKMLKYLIAIFAVSVISLAIIWNNRRNRHVKEEE